MNDEHRGYHHHHHHHHHDALRLEYVTTSVGFDDLLDVTLGLNHCHFDTAIVVTSHADKKTQAVAKKHGALCVLTDLWNKNGRQFNKGAAINDGFGRFQYHGWRAHLDSDIVVPDNFRRLLFSHTQLDTNAIYGADRVDVIGVMDLMDASRLPQHRDSYFVIQDKDHNISPRYVDTLRGYVPIGYFQLWHASCQKEYPWSLGSAAHDDVLFAGQWPRSHRHILPTVMLWHLLPEKTHLGQNWEGRKSMRLEP
jgi:hypothetical protein